MNLSQPPAFSYSDESRETAASRWKTWCEEFDLFIAASDIQDDPRIKCIMLHCAGPKVREIYATRSEANDKAKDVSKKITDHFAPDLNSDYGMIKFARLTQGSSENISDFLV